MTPVTGFGKDVYIDDRSAPEAVLRSYFNAINRQELVRAYSYWSSTSRANVLSFPDFQKQFSATTEVKANFGAVTGQGAAGSVYYTAATFVTSTMRGAASQTAGNCFLLRLGNPANQTVPPFNPLAIERLTWKVVGPADDPAKLLANTCQNVGVPPPGGSPTPTAEPSDVSRSHYLDDRSDPIQVVRSLVNAVNRREYSRAYSYWQAGAAGTQVPPFDQFVKGYASTESIDLTIGNVTSNPGAGQLNYQVPVTLLAKHADSTSQSFVGCYAVHLAEPDLQSVPPFHPMAIATAKVQQVPNDANYAALMGIACG
jgi:hypothetical protein